MFRGRFTLKAQPQAEKALAGATIAFECRDVAAR